MRGLPISGADEYICHPDPATQCLSRVYLPFVLMRLNINYEKHVLFSLH